MNAFHSFWSLPQMIRHGGVPNPPAYELLTQMLSALKWKELNGSISLYADSFWMRFLEEKSLLNLYDAGNAAILDSLSEEKLNANTFWAAGKLFSLKHAPLPCAVLDADLILWKDIRCEMKDTIVCTHAEPINDLVYPDFRQNQICNVCDFPFSWDWNVPAANTSFLFWPEKLNSLREFYLENSFLFMKKMSPYSLDPVQAMCFAEQRMLSMISNSAHQNIAFLLNEKSIETQDMITHLWGYKKQLERDPQKRDSYCRRCLARIQKDFSRFADIAEKIYRGID